MGTSAVSAEPLPCCKELGIVKGQQIALSVHPDGWLIKEDPSTNDRLE